tara:strand:+ start:170 stop:418 length:249 start_codon:yes stop_codon:yes gene_type:complete
MKPYQKRAIEWIASQLNTSIRTQEVRDCQGRRVRRISFNYVPEEYEEDWGKDLKDWTEQFESARLESIRRSQLWTKQQQERP